MIQVRWRETGFLVATAYEIGAIVLRNPLSVYLARRETGFLVVAFDEWVGVVRRNPVSTYFSMQIVKTSGTCLICGVEQMQQTLTNPENVVQVLTELS